MATAVCYAEIHAKCGCASSLLTFTLLYKLSRAFYKQETGPERARDFPKVTQPECMSLNSVLLTNQHRWEPNLWVFPKWSGEPAETALHSTENDGEAAACCENLGLALDKKALEWPIQGRVKGHDSVLPPSLSVKTRSLPKEAGLGFPAEWGPGDSAALSCLVPASWLSRFHSVEPNLLAPLWPCIFRYLYPGPFCLSASQGEDYLQPCLFHSL